MDKDKRIKSEDEESEEEEYQNSQSSSGSESGSDSDSNVKVEEEQDSEEEFDFSKMKKSNKRKAEQDIKEEYDNEEEEKIQVKKVKKNKENEDSDSDDDKNQIKWNYLEHHGVLFPDYWQRHHIRIRYDGEPIDHLSIYQEEMATYWAQTLGTDYEDRKIYRENFISEWMKTWKGNKQYSEFEKFDFWPIKNHLEEKKEERKNRTKEEKQAEKNKNALRDQYHGYAIIDGEREKIGGYMIEPPTLFKGRGEHPKAGLMKGRIMPEQYTINIAEDAPVPKCHMPGHNWKEIVHNKEVTWLGGYKDDTINKTHKYTQMAATSKFKYQNDIKKYERARRLKKIVHQIRRDYEKKMEKGNEKDRQLGTATYLIDKLALRVGNEKGEDEADTVGCCSLRVEHLKLPEQDKVEFDFLGKDSMRYHHIVEVTSLCWANIQKFMKGKQGRMDLFDRIDASDLNIYLKNFMDDLTAKVFRTYNASNTLQQQLDKIQEQNHANMSVDEKVNFYNNAVKQVAILCNHQKTASKTFDLSTQKIRDRIEQQEIYEKELISHITKVKKGKVSKEIRKEVILEKKDDGKHKVLKKVFHDSKDKAEKELKTLRNKIQKDKHSVEDRESNKDIALGTSKTNYNDPRVTVAWCKLVEQPIEKPFTKTLRDKFLWAMNIEPEWKF